MSIPDWGCSFDLREGHSFSRLCMDGNSPVRSPRVLLNLYTPLHRPTCLVPQDDGGSPMSGPYADLWVVMCSVGWVFLDFGFFCQLSWFRLFGT